MLKPLQFFQTLTQRITNSVSEDAPAIDIWEYAEPAGEEPDPLKRNVLQWRRIISSVRDPLETFPDQPVDVIGFVHRMPFDSPEQFTIARQIIRCCLADTVPLGLSVYSPKASQYETNSWLRIQGRFSIESIKGNPTLVVIPTKIRLIRTPKKLYINGVF
jgi:uncharacterized repeat protein (TIGR03943 family)